MIMGLFFNRRHNQEATKLDDKNSSIEVTKLKHKAHRTAEQADKDIKKLNALLRANGIEFKIRIAGGHRG